MNVVSARSLDEVLHALEPDDPPELLAGGTDFMVEVNFGRRRPSAVLALGRVPELRGWSPEAADDGVGGSLWVGAGTTYRELLGPELARRAPVLAYAARTVGSPQIRNAGTVGGNLGTASPAGDLLPPLLALGAVVELASSAGTRRVSVEDFLVGPKRTSLGAGEVITGVRFEAADGPQDFLKVGTRNAMVIAVASVATVVDWRTGRLRLALGSVGPTAMRAREAERLAEARLDVEGRRLSGGEAGLIEIADAAAEAARPIDDHRSSAEYRRHAVRVGVARSLRRILGGDRADLEVSA